MRHGNALTLLVLVSLPAMAGSGVSGANGGYVATAYSQSGITASGVPTERHEVAADPDVLPIGSRIKIRGAGRYSGEYVVADTGRKIQGRRLDIFIPSEQACVRFGRKSVKVRVLQVGNGTKKATETADSEVKKDVRNELSKKAVGGAATEEDWAARKKTAPTAPSSSGDAAGTSAANGADSPH